MWRLLPRVNINASILKKSPQVATKLARTITTNYQSLAWKPKNFKIHSGFAVNNTLLSYAVSLHNNTLFFARKYSTVPTENTPNKSQTSDTGAKQEQAPVEGSIPVEGTQTGQPIGNIFQNQENKDNNNNTNQEQEKTQRTIVSTTGPLEVAIRVSNWDHVRNVFSALLWIVLIYLIFFSKETPFSSFTASPAKEAQSEKTRLSDVKGNEEAKEELEDVILYLKETQRFINLGVKPPKGLLFVGPPGCGKTLLAKALAGEAGIPFFYTSGAEFEEMFVGVGAGRVRKLFQKARSGQGAIIFIDEIDAIGSRFDRDSSGKAGKMTLNQLLVEMDGFKPNDKVVVIAATNAPQVLDPALIRPGRFDRTVSVSLPQLQARKDIIELYLNDRAAPDVDIEKLARSTTGYSGADLFSMVNGAGIRAVKAKLPFITMSLLEKAKEDVALGPQRKSSPLSTEMKKLTAFHESGHALVALHASAEHEIDKATLIPRSKALGYVRFNRNLVSEENPLYSKEYLRNDIAIAMGGRAAEEIIFGADKVTPGASSDIEKATDIAESMVMDYGMSDKVGHQHISKEKLRMAASETKMLVDSEIKRILEEEYVRAKSILTTNKQQLHRLAESLIEYEELSLEEIKIVINGGDISQRKLEEEEQRKQHQQQSEQAFEKQQAEKLAELQQAAAKFNQNKKSSVNNFVEEIVSKFNRLSGLGW